MVAMVKGEEIPGLTLVLARNRIWGSSQPCSINIIETISGLVLGTESEPTPCSLFLWIPFSLLHQEIIGISAPLVWSCDQVSFDHVSKQDASQWPDLPPYI